MGKTGRVEKTKKNEENGGVGEGKKNRQQRKGIIGRIRGRSK